MKRALMFSTPKTIFFGVVGLAASLTQLLAGDETPKVAVDEAASAQGIHAHIVKTTTEKEPGDVKAYKENITGTGIGFDMVPIAGGRNFRDLGGYAAADGLRVRHGTVLRCGHPGEIGEDGTAQLAALSLGAIIDLLQTEESNRTP